MAEANHETAKSTKIKEGPKEKNPKQSETEKVEVSQFVKVETQNTKKFKYNLFKLKKRADTEKPIKKEEPKGK